MAEEAFVPRECAFAECFEAGKNKCAQCNTRYCSRECQKADWKFHKKLCAQSSPTAAPPPEDELCCRGLSLEEEFIRGLDALGAEGIFYTTVDKNRKRDRFIDLQNVMRNAMMGQGGDFEHAQKVLNKSLERQYVESLTVEPNDSFARLESKGIIQEVLKGIYQQMGIQIYSRLDVKMKSKLIICEMRIRMQRLTDLTELIRLKNHPLLATMPLSGSCVETIRKRVLAKKGPPKDPVLSPGELKKVPKNRAPFFPGPPAWCFPEGLDAIKELYNKMGQNTYSFMFRNIHVQREMDKNHRFYCFNYPSNYAAASLTFTEHCKLHRIGGASVTVNPEAEAVLLSDDKKLTVQGFKGLSNVTILLPHVVVGSCDYCHKAAVGECVCGECYCSAACHANDWPSHHTICHTVLDNNAALCMATPFGWGQRPYHT